MQQVAKEGFLFVSILKASSKTADSDSDWNRRWFKLDNAILFCYASFSGELLMTIDLISLNVSHDEIKWPSSVDDKPFVISLRVRDRDQTILLEADCEVCMESWATQLTGYLPSEYTSMKNDSLTYEIMESYVREKRSENVSAPDKTGQNSGSDSEEFPYVINDFSKSLPTVQDPLPKSNTLDRHTSRGKKGLKNEFQDSCNSIQTHHSQQNSYKNKSYRMFPKKSKPKVDKQLTFNRILSTPPAGKKDRTLSFHNYYEVEDVSPLTGSKVGSNEAENYYEAPESFFLSGNVLRTDSRRLSHSSKKSIESNLDQPGKDYRDLTTLQSSSSFSEDAFLASIPHYQELLDTNWLMCFILPNGKVYTQLIDITLPIESSLKLLLECFSHPGLNSCLSLKIIGDLHQTFSRADTKKGFQSLSWELTFRSQGVMESKILQISVINNEGVKLDLELLENFLYRMHHLPNNEMFSLSWVSFVKGNFPELDVSVSARHSACIYLIYSRMQGIGKLDMKKFIPSPLEKLPAHLQAVSQYIESYALYKVSSLCEVFVNEVNASLTGNAISLIAKKVIIMKRKIKYDPCILTICRQHIGIVRPDIASHYDKPDTFSNLYHYQNIQSWLLNEPLDVVAIKLTEDKDDDWTKFKIVKTNAMKTVDLLFRDFFQVAKYYSKSVDLV